VGTCEEVTLFLQIFRELFQEASQKGLGELEEVDVML